MIFKLVELQPDISAERIVQNLVPSPLFATASFETYLPDEQFASQSKAREALIEFVGRWQPKARAKLFSRSKPVARPQGIYLDGGFGVGKTHLLAATFHAAPGPKAFGTFIEYTSLVGALGYRTAAEQLQGYRLVCIDEFELDDPGDTLIMTRLLNELAANGTAIVATSNTPPNALGEGRFAAADFLREIQSLASVFETLRIDGSDYRARDVTATPDSLSDAQLSEIRERLDTQGLRVGVDTFRSLAEHLSRVHPVKYSLLAESADFLLWQDVEELTNQNEALRMVALVDRLYDNSVPILGSGVSLTTMFSEEILSGGYRKKYLRAMSRLGALAALGFERARKI